MPRLTGVTGQPFLGTITVIPRQGEISGPTAPMRGPFSLFAPTRKPTPPPASCATPSPGSPTTASPSNGSCPTTAPTAHWPGATPAPNWRSHRKTDPALPAPDQRQDRTFPPHPRRRLGLRPLPPHRHRPPSRSAPMACSHWVRRSVSRRSASACCSSRWRGIGSRRGCRPVGCPVVSAAGRPTAGVGPGAEWISGWARRCLRGCGWLRVMSECS